MGVFFPQPSYLIWFNGIPWPTPKSYIDECLAAGIIKRMEGKKDEYVFTSDAERDDKFKKLND